MTGAEENLRADARANRDRIVEVAREALTSDPQAALSTIAKTAGVGQGTLYRHFPTRETLVLAVYQQEIDCLVVLASSLLDAHPPLQAFRLWCDRLVEAGRMKHGVAEVLRSATSDRDTHETYRPMVGALRQMLEACEHAGAIRPGADAEDVLILLGVLWRIPPTDAGRERANRIVSLLLHGLGAA